MDLLTTDGYAFSTYYGVSLTTNLVTELETNVTLENGTVITEYR